MLDIVPMDFVAGAIGAIARAALGSSLQVPRLSTYFGKMAAFVMASA
jgi:hypothetical protein